MLHSDLVYYRQRAAAERKLATATANRDVAEIHEELARQYEALIEHAELRGMVQSVSPASPAYPSRPSSAASNEFCPARTLRPRTNVRNGSIVAGTGGSRTLIKRASCPIASGGALLSARAFRHRQSPWDDEIRDWHPGKSLLGQQRRTRRPFSRVPALQARSRSRPHRRSDGKLEGI